MGADRKEINGQTWTIASHRKTKSDADKYATSLRKEGWNARVIKEDVKYVGNVYCVYKHR